MPGTASWWNWARTNLGTAKRIMATPTGRSFTKWTAGGAIAGGVWGAVDPRESMMGGAFSGAMKGAGLRGIGHLAGFGFGRGRAGGSWGGINTSGFTGSSSVAGAGFTMRDRYWRPGRGLI